MLPMRHADHGAVTASPCIERGKELTTQADATTSATVATAARSGGRIANQILRLSSFMAVLRLTTVITRGGPVTLSMEQNANPAVASSTLCSMRTGSFVHEAQQDSTETAKRADNAARPKKPPVLYQLLRRYAPLPLHFGEQGGCLKRKHGQGKATQASENGRESIKGHDVSIERPGSGRPGQWCSIANRDGIPALPAAG
jgi:hypothetical protein